MITNIVLVDKKKDFLDKNINLAGIGLNFDYSIFVSLIFFGISAGLALLHRYFGADSKAYHLSYIRLEEKLSLIDKKPDSKPKRGLWSSFKLYLDPPHEDDAEKRAKNEKDARDFLLKFSGGLLFFSALFLWLGAMLLVLSFTVVIFNQ
ncbi:MAG: hypothetical protein M3384_21345 [Acidobacteriota bacterium]|nr:hypothetical protein [Acidobacteriota bacterium]